MLRHSHLIILTGLIVGISVEITLGLVTTEAELKTECDDIATNTGLQTHYSDSSKTCIHLKNAAQKSYDDAENDCDTGAPVGTVGRLLHVASSDLADLATPFGSGKEGFLGGKRLDRYIQNTVSSPQESLGDFKWFEFGKCTTYFNATIMVEKETISTNTDHCLAWSDAFITLDCTTPNHYFCEYYLGPRMPETDCKISTHQEMKDFCAENKNEHDYLIWSEESSTCARRYLNPAMDYIESYTECTKLAPPGTAGRLVFVTTSDLLLEGHEGYIGLKIVVNDSVTDFSGLNLIDHVKWVYGNESKPPEDVDKVLLKLHMKFDSADVNTLCFRQKSSLYESISCTDKRKRICQFYFPTPQSIINSGDKVMELKTGSMDYFLTVQLIQNVTIGQCINECILTRATCGGMSYGPEGGGNICRLHRYENDQPKPEDESGKVSFSIKTYA